MSAADTTPPSLRAAVRAERRVPITLRRGLAVFALYVVVTFTAQTIGGVDYDEINASTSNVLRFVIVPIGLGIVAVLALTARWGWWQQLFHERERLASPRWLWLIPALFAVPIVANLVDSPWGDWDANIVILLLVGMLMVGFAEEIVFRGYVLLGARSRYTEVGAWLLSSALFAAFHGENLLLGQALGTTVQQVLIAFVFGGTLYLVRRVSGLLVVGMILHGLWDFATFAAAGPGDSTVHVTSGSPAAQGFALVAMALTIAALVVVFRRHSTARGEPAAS